MSESAAAFEIPAQRARPWVRESLAAGHEVSAAALAGSRLEGGVFRAILPAGARADAIQDFDCGGVIQSGIASAAFGQVLDELADEGAACIVVEDSVARRTDPALQKRTLPYAFVGDQVVSWAELDVGAGVGAADAVGRVGSSYPRNAFVTSRSATDLGLANHRTMPGDFATGVEEGLMAVAVAAFDAESYVIWSET